MGFWAVVIASVVFVFLWGLFSPRSQWKVLAAWSYRNPQADEPSSFAFAVQRVISGIGVIFFGAIGAVGVVQYLAELPPPRPPLTALQQMWGVAPEPQVVNRIVVAEDAVPAGLVEAPIGGYQLVENEEHQPRYLHLLKRFEPGDFARSGMVGVTPGEDFPALDSAELVVNIRTWGDCIPRDAVVIETETTVQVGFYVGMSNRQDDIPVDHLACDRPAFVQNSLLMPIDLAAEVGDREVQTLDGTPIPEVKEIRQ
ncbi:cytochrome c oxidase subunit II [Homoserinimonas sp. A447]